MKSRPQIAILMSVRNEEAYIDLHLSYHLDLGFDFIFIVDHCSTDGTRVVLKSYAKDPRVVVIEEKEPVFDHARIANHLLLYANTNYQIDWFIFLDVDEFLSIGENDVHDFIARLESKNIPYATIGWANALFDYTFSDYTCSPTNPIDTTKYFYPWPERPWQEYGHFRKAIVGNHERIEIVVGGHYVETGNNIAFFGEYHWNPFIIPKSEARLLHFEFRGRPEEIYRKWETLAKCEHDSTSSTESPWMERLDTIRKYVEQFKGNIEEIEKRWFSEHRSFWGTLVPQERIVYDTTLARWYGKYLRRKLESGEIKSLCLVRSGHLGDVVMTEPVARFLSQYVNTICLATDVKQADLLFATEEKTYDKIFPHDKLVAREIDCDAVLKMVYELSSSEKTYIQGYMEYAGFGEQAMHALPRLNDNWQRIEEGEYILIAPHTSRWEEGKRNWGYEKFLELAQMLESEYGMSCILLEREYSFPQMLSLIRHCAVFVGNDSGPAVIAQSFDKKSFVIFGGTSPSYLHLCRNAVAIYDRNRHALCKHEHRKDEMDCCEEFCMARIRVVDVFDTIRKHLRGIEP